MTSVIEDLRSEIARLKAQGHTAVALDELDRYLASRVGTSGGDAGSPPIRFEEWRHRTALAHESQLQTVKATLEAGQSALRSTILINGGAAAALLAFLGNVLTKETRAVNVSIAGMRWALQLFVLGVFCSAAASAWRYFSSFSDSMLRVRYSQIESARENAVVGEAAVRSVRRWARFGIFSTVSAILFGLASIAVFIWGGIKAAQSIW